MKDDNDKFIFPLDNKEIEILKLRKKLRFYMAYTQRLENDIKKLKTQLEKYTTGQ